MDLQEKGKIPHEVRDPETDSIAQKITKEKNWGWPYYGGIDTTAKNVLGITTVALQDENPEFLNETYVGLDGEAHSVEHALHEHINWLRKRMELNPDSLVEMLQKNPKHHANEYWADSAESMHHADGSWPQNHPEKNWGVASVMVQAEVYDALNQTVELYKKLSGSAVDQKKTYLETEIGDLTQRADRLKQTVLTKFWVEDPTHYGGFFARGTDRDDQGNLRPMAIRSADMGYLLNSGILDGDKADVVRKREAVIKNLFSPEMLCANGIRTLSSDSVRYFEDKYHNGNSWPWVTYDIALGLQKHGYYGLSYELKKRIWSLYDASHVFPEFGTGTADTDPAKRLIRRRITIEDPSMKTEPIHAISQWNQEELATTAAAILAMKIEEGDRRFGKANAVPIRAIDPEKRKFEDEIFFPTAK
jgi:glycogen debranching enzyme